MTEQTVDQILDALERGRQRATYGAVASAVQVSPRLLMKGRTRDRRHSWIVNRTTGLPTGYEVDDLHPELQAHPDVLATGQQLAAWMERMSQ